MEFYYSYTDYLGSILAVTDQDDNVINRYNYDPWGRERNPDNWDFKYSTENNLSWLFRGYTGHEMLPEFDLVNMNGRLYDPVIGRMLSPDNNAGFDGTSQSYNRYSYALNNPLKYTDPNGELPIAPIIVGAMVNYAFDQMFNDGKGGWQRIAIGAASGLVTGGIGDLFVKTNIFAGLSGTVKGELLRAGLHGLSSGIFSEISGGNFTSGFASGVLSSSLGSMTSGVEGGWFVSGVGGGIIGSAITGGDPLLSVTQGLIINLVNHQMHKDHDPPKGKRLRFKFTLKLTKGSFAGQARARFFLAGGHLNTGETSTNLEMSLDDSGFHPTTGQDNDPDYGIGAYSGGGANINLEINEDGGVKGFTFGAKGGPVNLDIGSADSQPPNTYTDAMPPDNRSL